MIDFSLTDEQQLIQKTARDFAENEVRPVAERIQQADGGIDTWSVSRGVFEQAAELGFTTMLIPEAYGGGGRSGIDVAILIEEIAAVDLGIANALGATIGYPLFIAIAGTDAQREAWLTELTDGGVHLLAGAQSEPNVAGSEFMNPDPDPSVGMRTFARRDGDGYVIDGTKSAFITNAGVASHYFIVCRTSLDQPLHESMSMFYLPADTPGLAVGRRTHLIGMKTGWHAEVRLESVRVGADRLLGGEGGAYPLLAATLGQGIGAQFVGLARGAYEYALAYTKERRSWGKPVGEHQAVALMLADMEMEIQAARLLTWDSIRAAESMDPSARIKGMASKTFAVDVAIKTAQNAMKILGGYGVALEYLTPKFLGDAMTGYSCDFTGDFLRLRIAELL